MQIRVNQKVYRNKDGKVGYIYYIRQGVSKTYTIKFDDGEIVRHLGRRLVKDFSFLPDYDNLFRMLITPTGAVNMAMPLPASKQFYLWNNLDIDWIKVVK